MAIKDLKGVWLRATGRYSLEDNYTHSGACGGAWLGEQKSGIWW